MRSLRIWFAKTGDLKYLSHLDLMRFIVRAFRRTEIPIWYTEGFNPRPHVVFGLSLPLGVEGENEAFDLRLSDDSFPDEKVVPALQSVSVPGLKFLRAAEPIHKPQDIAFASFYVNIDAGEHAEELVAQFQQKVNSGEILIEKKSKNGRLKTINVCEHLSSFSFSQQENGQIRLQFVLSAGNEANINPLTFCTALAEGTGFDSRLFAVTREKLLISDLTEYR